MVAAGGVWIVGEPLLGHELVVQQPGQDATDLGLAEVAFIALAASLLGWALLAGLERRTHRAIVPWTVTALAVLAVSFVPFVGVEATTGTKVVLASTHLAVVAVLVPVFWRSSGLGDRATSDSAVNA